jgi:hypothetical protein
MSQRVAPVWLDLGEEKPDVVFSDLSKCIVVEVKATQLIRHGNGIWNLRFPRLVALRPDKNLSDVMTLSG